MQHRLQKYLRGVGLAFILAFAAAACGRDAAPSEPIFGTADTTCESVVLLNEDSDQDVLDAAVDCLFGEIDAGNPVTVDLDIPTVEGDSIYYRYAFDGETTLIVIDNRGDEFGAPIIRAEQCRRLVRTGWEPRGEDCVGIDHDGFPEAVS